MQNDLHADKRWIAQESDLFKRPAAQAIFAAPL
jgi:hypothetical protein